MSKNDLQSAQQSINEIEETLNSISQKQKNEDAFVDKANTTFDNNIVAFKKYFPDICLLYTSDAADE